MHIKESFRDDKSGGFDLEAAHLSDPKHLDTLLLALAVAVLWVYELCEQVRRDDRRSEVNPAYKRQLSVFQLGWRLLRRLVSCTEPPLCTLQIKPFKPEPVWLGKCWLVSPLRIIDRTQLHYILCHLQPVLSEKPCYTLGMA